MGDGAATQQQQLLLQQEAEAAPKRAGGVDIDAIRGQRLWVQFAAFRFFERTCQLELRENGDCQFSKGMVAEVGNWRIEVRARTRACDHRETYGRSICPARAYIYLALLRCYTYSTCRWFTTPVYSLICHGLLKLQRENVDNKHPSSTVEGLGLLHQNVPFSPFF